MKLSVVLAVQNEPEILRRCLNAIKDIANEIIIVDDASTEDIASVAKSFGAEVFPFKHVHNFHEAKQFGIDKANGDWILQLDADEVVTRELSDQIKNVIASETKQSQSASHPKFNSGSKIPKQARNNKLRLFDRYQKLIEKRDGVKFETEGEIVAYFIPRLNIFLGQPIKHGGIYPDAVIRLWKKGSAYLPAKSVHELPVVSGRVSWLSNDLLHYDSPTFSRYLERHNRYTDLIAKDFEKQKLPANILYLLHYSFTLPLYHFLNLYLRHKGILDGFPGFVWSLFSALRFPISYFKYWATKHE